MQAIGAFIKSSGSIDDDSMDMDDNPDTTLLAYVNGDHEYAPRSHQTLFHFSRIIAGEANFYGRVDSEIDIYNLIKMNRYEVKDANGS